MNKPLPEKIADYIEDFCAIEFKNAEKTKIIEFLNKTTINENTEISKRQFNEILLICKETRVSNEFFHYFTNGKDKLKLKSLPELVERFKKHSMLQFGNFKFALKKLTMSKNIKLDIGSWLNDPQEIIAGFKNRQDPILNISKIPRDKIHNIGYLSADGKDDKTQKIRETGEFNTNVYLTSDYMDVYVATSMRDKSDYQSVFDFCEAVFSNPLIKDLKLRYFDPTQSFHNNNRAKGLIEGLMIKRAKCTIYIAQESDSFGKDSELAATLAQGKSVIAFIPKYNPQDKTHLKNFRELSLNKLYDKAEIYIEKVKDNDWRSFTSALDIIDENLDNKSEDWIKNEMGIKLEELIKIIAYAEAEFYEDRAELLKYIHPLGFQVNLNSGVANGVLVTRTYKETAELLFNVLTNNLEFDILKPGEKITSGEELPVDDLNYLLIEKKSKCAFRIVTTDELLTNSFWNFYLD